MSNSKQYQKDDDNISLADMMSLKMTLTDTQKKLKNDTPLMWNHDYLPQQQQQQQQQIWYQQQQQLQASYYQLQYLQQQQMMSMMMRYRSHSSSHSNTSSRRSSTISSVSSNHSSGSHKPSHQRSSLLLHQQQQQHFSSKSSISSDKSTKSDTLSQVPKRRQSLGKRIKKALRMSTGTAIQEEEEMDSSHKKKLPDSPNSNISRPTRHHRHPPSFDLPSPALSTVSTISSSTTTFTKKSLSFNPVIKLHETFSAFEYDRRCDTSVTCQKLTPVLALQIKEELNHFKLNDMLVHTDSRQNTHFFI